jgi:hypothetical protein
MNEVEKESHQSILVSHDQLFKRGVVTRSDFQHQLNVRVRQVLV